MTVLAVACLRSGFSAVVFACMQAGYKVVGVDNSPQEDPALQHDDYCFSSIDITKAEQTEQVAALVTSQGSGLQTLINNAGIADPYLPEGSSERLKHWNKVIDTNLTGRKQLK